MHKFVLGACILGSGCTAANPAFDARGTTSLGASDGDCDERSCRDAGEDQAGTRGNTTDLDDDGGLTGPFDDGPMATGGATDAGTTEGDTKGGSSGGSEAVCGDGRRHPDEPCDDGDDDELDGCTSSCELGPTGIAFGPASPTQPLGGSAEPTEQGTDACPSDEVLIGFEGRLTSEGVEPTVVLGRMRGVCGRVSLVDADPTSVEISDGASLRTYGQFDDGDSFSLVCPRGTGVVAVEGQGGTVLDSLRLHCAKLSVTGQGGSQQLELVEAAGAGPVGGELGEQLGPEPCPAGAVATGAHVAANSYILRVGLVCSSISLAY